MVKAIVGLIRRFAASEDGPSTVEYALIIGFIFLAVISIVQVLGLTTASSLQDSGGKMSSALDAHGSEK